MKTTKIVPGILAVIGGLFAFFYPGLTSIMMAWLLTVILAVTGISMIVGYVHNGKQHKMEGAYGGGVLVLGIVLAVIAILGLLVPAVRVALEMIVIIIFVFHLISNGITMIAIGFSKKGNMPVLSVILGIILLIVGIYGIVHLFYAAMTMSIFIGTGLLSYGFSLLFANGNDL